MTQKLIFLVQSAYQKKIIINIITHQSPYEPVFLSRPSSPFTLSMDDNLNLILCTSKLSNGFRIGKLFTRKKINIRTRLEIIFESIT